MSQHVARGQGGHGPVCKTGKDGFNSRSRIQLAPVARMDRRPISTRVYAGSNPAWSANACVAQRMSARVLRGMTLVRLQSQAPMTTLIWRVNRRGDRKSVV